MGTFLLVLAIFGILLAGMSIGVIMGRKPISGTCGGIGALGISGACEICGGDRNKCDEENERTATEASRAEALSYDATESKPH
ncbi:(Na+)-NQR maturation NqrM [Marinobacter nanhaiticus D15-8W]|uniref:(Na+)-NQR maturation NqrM n=1 Tax=Marinobacter nanhaiticus D15-8W TaxID=626887 RepID=N6WR91_9GAMM|nr:(Na+)-NQR maturation NqrM [Marinobacter nanhaiticus]ENO13577.1 (Na+)-NQR maturation NqrM [Marinobacter nanhaiticus D15-8W]BES70948.1 (Na+)-NQR maturation NqrM [Marinobacter nanhaiticus D15-8W]